MLQASTSVRSLKLPSFLIGDNGLPHSYRNSVCTLCSMRDPNGSPAAVSSPTTAAQIAAISPIAGGLLGVASAGAGSFLPIVTPRLNLPPQATTPTVSMVQMPKSTTSTSSSTSVPVKVEAKIEAKRSAADPRGRTRDDDEASVDGATLSTNDNGPDSDRCPSKEGVHKYDDGVCRYCGSLQDLGDVVVGNAPKLTALSSPVAATSRPLSICPNSAITSSEAQSRRDNVIACFGMGLEKNSSLVELDIGDTFPNGLTAPQSRSLYASICGGALRRRLRTLSAASRPIVTLLPASDVKVFDALLPLFIFIHLFIVGGCCGVV
jgi:hypothetical protein